MEYLFGDTDIAARRLKVLAEVYAEPTRAFLLDAVADEPRLAVDVGCGPGYTTHLLSDALHCERTAGLDNSEHFVSLAKKTETEKVSFYLHDVTSLPFPAGSADLIYCRMLLTHLKELRSLIADWGTQLQPGGLLLIEEVEWIHMEKDVFKDYIKIVDAMLEHQSNQLYVGPLLDAFTDIGGLKKRASRVRRKLVKNSQAATMFFLNMQFWKESPFIRANHSPETIDRLEQGLYALSDESNREMDIEWGMRQLVYQRV